MGPWGHVHGDWIALILNEQECENYKWDDWYEVEMVYFKIFAWFSRCQN